MGSTQARRYSRPIPDDLDDNDDLYDTRMRSSVRRYKSVPSTQREIQQQADFHRGKSLKPRRASLDEHHAIERTTTLPVTDEFPLKRRHPLVTIGLGMVIMILLVIGLRSLFSWWQIYQDDQQYGRPRTSHLDAVVGHGDSPTNPTHFIFINLNRHIEIIEIPGGDPARTRIFTGPILLGNGQDLTPVTGEIRDDNGRRDLILHIQDQRVLFINDGTTFHPQS